MIIYSVHITVDGSAVEDWARWMKAQHIPDVMKTGYFTAFEFGQVVAPVDENGRVSFRIDYRCPSNQQLDEYQRTCAPRLQAEHAARFSDRFVASRAVIQIIS